MGEGSFRTSILPWLSVRDSPLALEFYKAAFGAVELYRHEGDGIVAQLAVDGAEFWMAEASPEQGNPAPEEATGTPVRIILTVEDPDAMYARALAAGARVHCPLTNDHGWRVGRVVDPFGHHWEIARKL